MKQMIHSEWEPVYREILEDMGYSRSEDEACARLLKALMTNADLIDPDDIEFKDTVAVIGPADPDLSDLDGKTVISAGSATEILCREHIVPDIVVTDLDGDTECQIAMSRKGAVTFIHAHGDNTELVMRYAKEFTGPVVLTTQSVPDRVIQNFGGFTDGDRAVCIAREHGCTIELRGFDFQHPCTKDRSDPEVKMRKLRWAERIIRPDSPDIVRI